MKWSNDRGREEGGLGPGRGTGLAAVVSTEWDSLSWPQFPNPGPLRFVPAIEAWLTLEQETCPDLHWNKGANVPFLCLQSQNSPKGYSGHHDGATPLLCGSPHRIHPVGLCCSSHMVASHTVSPLPLFFSLWRQV